MNKRTKKKKFKQHHKQFCYPIKYEFQCPKCGWDSIEADEDGKIGEILWEQYYPDGMDYEIKYKCPLCGTEFGYVDGT